MRYGIGDKVEVTTTLYLGRWIYPTERGEVLGQHFSPAEQEVYDVILEDGKGYTLAPSEIKRMQI